MNPIETPIFKDIKRLLLVILAAVIFAVNTKSFIHSGGLLPGGFSGVTLLIQDIGLKFFNVSIPYSLVNLPLNSIPVYICFKVIGHKFTILSCICFFLCSILIDFIPVIAITYDPLLTSIFGGIVSGTACLICLTANATSGGTDFIAIYLAEKHNIDAFNYILMANAVVLLIAGTLFGWDKALYSIIYQFTATQVIHVCYKRYKKNTLLIITEKPDAVANVIAQHTRHGSTSFSGFGTYESKPRTMVYSVVGRAEVKKVIPMLKSVDERVFINVLKSESIEGNFYTPPTD